MICETCSNYITPRGCKFWPSGLVPSEVIVDEIEDGERNDSLDEDGICFGYEEGEPSILPEP